MCCSTRHICDGAADLHASCSHRDCAVVMHWRATQPQDLVCFIGQANHSRHGGRWAARPSLWQFSGCRHSPGVQRAAAVSRGSAADGCRPERSPCKERASHQQVHRVPTQDLLVSRVRIAHLLALMQAGSMPSAQARGLQPSGRLPISLTSCGFCRRQVRAAGRPSQAAHPLPPMRIRGLQVRRGEGAGLPLCLRRRLRGDRKGRLPRLHEGMFMSPSRSASALLKKLK